MSYKGQGYNTSNNVIWRSRLQHF